MIILKRSTIKLWSCDLLLTYSAAWTHNRIYTITATAIINYARRPILRIIKITSVNRRIFLFLGRLENLYKRIVKKLIKNY
jgi:hypothetical protein